MSIQQIIDQQIAGTKSDKGDDGPQGVITIENQSGSFTLPEKVRLILRNCSVDCSGNGGDNELNCVGCGSVSIKGFKKGVIRLERCGSADISTSEKTVLNVAGTSIQKLDLTKTQATVVGCQVEDSTLNGSELTSIKNQFQKFSQQSGTFYSENDQFQGDVEFQGGTGTLVKPNFQGKVSATGASLTLTNAQYQNEVTINSARVTDINGQYQQKLTISGASLAVIRNIKVQEEVSMEGSINITTADFQKDTSFQNCKLNMLNATGHKTLSIQNSSGVLHNCQWKDDDTTISSSAIKNVAGMFKKVNISGGAYDSEGNQYQDDFSQSGGTIESLKDTWQKKISLTNLGVYNKIVKGQGSDDFTASGSQTSSIEIVDLTGLKTVSGSGFGNAVWDSVTGKDFSLTNIMNGRYLSLSGQTLMLSNLAVSNLNGCTFTKDCTFTSLGTLIGDQSQFNKVTATNCFHLFTAGSTVADDFILTNVDLATTDAATKLTVTNCTLIDNGSTILSLSTSILIGRGTTVQQATGCNMNMNGGSVVDAVGCVITGNGTVISDAHDSRVDISNGEVTSSTGCNIDSLNSTVNAITSNIKCVGSEITCAGLSLVNATASDVNNMDGLSVGTSVDPAQSGGALSFADGILTLQATIGLLYIHGLFDVQVTAAGDIQEEAIGEISRSSATIVDTGAASISLDAPLITEN